MPPIAIAVWLLASQQATGASWNINQDNALVWEASVYQPVGARIEGTPDWINRAHAAGVNDVIVELPSDGTGWGAAFAALEKNKMRYLVAFHSAAPAALGVVVEPESYRVPSLASKTMVEFPLPSCERGLMVLAMQRDASVQMVRRFSTREGFFSEEIDPQSDLEHTLLVFPEAKELRFPDYWSKFDAYRDRMLKALRADKPGAGLRGFVNPLGSMVRFPDQQMGFVPLDPLFQMELEVFLKRKYTTLTTAARNWGIGAPDFGSFGDFAKLVPLWSSSRGIPYLWVPGTDHTYLCDQRRSLAWSDIEQVIRESASKRYQRLAHALQQVCNVPVIQDWVGWSGPYGQARPLVDGLGLSMSGDDSGALDMGARAASTALRWTASAWFLATNLDVPRAQVTSAAASAFSLGAQGCFVRVADPTTLGAIAEIAAAGRLAAKPRGLFYPYGAMNPASPSKLAGGTWWLPAQGNGSRIDYGSGYEGYRYSDGGEQYLVFWSVQGERRVLLQMSNAAGANFESVGGADVDPKPVRKGVQATVGRNPIIVRGTSEIPVPEDAYLATVKEIDLIVNNQASRLPNQDSERLNFRDTIAAFDRNPGGSFLELRNQLARLRYLQANYIWIEAERTTGHTLSDVWQLGGLSANGALRLKSRIPARAEGFTANFVFTPRAEGDHTVWMAAKVPADLRRSVGLKIGEQTLRLNDEPMSPYSDGFAWFRMGTLRLSRSQVEAQLRIQARGQIEVAFDAILVTPGAFVPNGVAPPPN